MAIGKSKLHEFLRRGKVLNDAVLWFKIFDTNLKTQILNYIKVDQLTNQGIDKDGDVIGYYSYATELMHPEKEEGTHYTLDLTGKFYESIYITVLKDVAIINANPMKGDDNLFYKYGEGIIGLTNENFQKLSKEIKRRYIIEIKNVLFNY